VLIDLDKSGKALSIQRIRLALPEMVRQENPDQGGEDADENAAAEGAAAAGDEAAGEAEAAGGGPG
jgi:hypothetical protein